MYAKIARPLGIVGVIEVEASPWLEDNLWVLETIQPEPIMIGTVGNLRPENPEFAEYLERYAKNRLYRGIRYGSLCCYDLTSQVENPIFIEGLKLLAQHDLVLETANQNIALLQAAVQVSDKVPDLRIVLDHLPALDLCSRDARCLHDSAEGNCSAPQHLDQTVRDRASRASERIVGANEASARRSIGLITARDLPSTYHRARAGRAPGAARHADELFWGRPGCVWQRLAERSGRVGTSGYGCSGARVLRRQRQGGSGEILLEEFGCRLQVDQAYT
jgi:hypothetical protein